MTDTVLRLSIFLAVLVIMMLWEALWPNRVSPVSRKNRWLSNFVLVVCNSLLARIILPMGLIVIAIYAQQNQLGLINLSFYQSMVIPSWLTIALAVLVLDCLIYWQHRLFHKVPWLWKMHKVHHADPHLDASTGLRFHPLEIALSLLIKFFAVISLGIPAEAIFIFEIVLNASSIFNHANIKLPAKLEWTLRKVIVTQAMHRIHHSQRVAETNSNFGFNLSIWDKLFNSYTAHARLGDDGLKLGLKQYSTEKTNTNLLALLLMPFRKDP